MGYDPSSFDRAKDETLKFLRDQGAFTAYLPPELRPQFERETINGLALSALQGKIQNGEPELARDELMSGTWDSFLDADRKPQLLTAAQVAINGQGVEAERLRKAEERAAKAQREQIGNQFVAKLMDTTLTVPEVLASNLEPTGENSKDGKQVKQPREQLKRKARMALAVRAFLFSERFVPGRVPCRNRMPSNITSS
jgi:hypothetical protein